MLEEGLGPLTALDVEFSAVLALADLGRFARPYDWCGNGAPPLGRVSCGGSRGPRQPKVRKMESEK